MELIMITIKEIADLAGVSTTTISNVIHGKTDKMKPDTLERINEILKEKNYIPNLGARLVASNRSKLIGVIINNPSTEDKNALQDPYTGELFGAMEREIRKMGYYMLSYVAENESSLSNRIHEILNMALGWKTDGLILIGMNTLECETLIKISPIPLVFIDSYCDHPDCINVGIDDKQGGYLLTNYLISLGHKKIAFLADRKPPIDVDGARMAGHCKALEEANLPFTEESIILLSRNLQKRMENLEKLYHNLSEYSALFFCSDYYASEALQFFLGKGINIPNDLSITGFDDNCFSQLVIPGITTIRQPVALKGATAVQKLITLIENNKLEEKKTLFPVELIIRESVSAR
jgi:LacI family transcriptional regulator